MRKYAISLIVIFVILILGGTAACLYFLVFQKNDEGKNGAAVASASGSQNLPDDEEIPLTDATGGNVVQEDGDYKYHIFNSNGTFTVTQGGTNVDFLVIGGGGAGGKAPFTGNRITGGGGAGGYRTSYGTSGRNSQAEAPLLLSPGNYDVVVGAGGDASATAPGHEHGRKRDGLEKKPRTPLPVGLRFT